MSDPYRTAADFMVGPSRPGILTRMWRAVFGRLVYTGPETCGHCKYWRLRKKYNSRWNCWETPSKGDCKLLFSRDGEETKEDETCDRFKPRRRYKHRERA